MSVGEALVGHVAHEGVAEPGPARPVPDQEVRQPVDRSRVEAAAVVRQQHRDGLLVDRRPEDGRVAQHGAIRGSEPVDLAGDQALDRLGQVDDRAGPAGVEDQRLEEHRIAAAPFDEVRHRLPAAGVLVERHLDEPQASAASSGRGRDGEHSGAGPGDEPGRIVATGDDEQPRSSRRAVDQLGQDECRGLVHGVGVLDEDDGRLRESRAQELAHHLPEPGHQELPAELPGLAGRRQLEVQGEAEQGQPGHELRGIRRDVRRQDVGDPGGVGTGRHPEDLAEQPAEDGVRRGGLVLLTGDDHHPDVVDRRQQLGDQPGLADPGGTHDVDQLSPSRSDIGQRPRQHGHLVGAPDQRQRCAPPWRVPRSGPTSTARTGRDLPLTRNGWQLGGAEERVRSRDHLRGGQHLPGKGLAHHPCGEVDRVSLDRERTPERRPEVAREHVSAVDADAQGEAPGTVQHLPGDPQHPLLVVVGAARSAGGEHDLAAVAVDVGLEEGDVVVGAGVLDVAHDVVERLGQRARPLRGEQRVGARRTARRPR